ncbi:MAG: ABC transporter substrate-binding protein [Thermomicrobiales bacterium]
MSEERIGIERLLSRLDGVSRRDFLKRSAIMGAAVPAFASLLAACGGDDDDDDDDTGGDEDGGSSDPTATTSRSVPTSAVGGQEATATEEEAMDDEPTATAGDEGGEDEPTATEEADSGDSGEGQQGGTLILMGHHEIASLSPDDAGPTVHWVMVTQIHNALVELDAWYVLQPTLAESFEVTDDGSTYTFNLVDGVLFHDGEQFTSEDVKYTFDFYMNPENAMLTASDFAGITSVETPDDLTVVMSLEGPNAAFLANAGQAFIVPQHHHSEIGEDAYKSDPIGTGPFMLSEYRAAEFTECVAFEDHFRGRPLLDAVREKIVPEPSVRSIELETGEADSSVWALVTEDNIRLRDSGDFTTYVTSSTAVNHFPMNNERPYFADREVRRALMYALDRDLIVNELWQGLAVKATANISPALDFYYEPDVTEYPYDPDMAVQILEDAGWVAGSDGVREKDGVKLEWTIAVIAGDQARRPEAEFAQESWNAIGCNVSIEDTTSASSGMRDGTHDMSLYNWTYGGGSGEPDGSNTLRSDALNNFSKYKSDQMDELLDAGLAETDPDARAEIYSQVQKLVAEDVPFIFVKYWDWFNFYNKRVKGLPEDVLAGSQLYNACYTMWKEEES